MLKDVIFYVGLMFLRKDENGILFTPPTSLDLTSEFHSLPRISFGTLFSDAILIELINYSTVWIKCQFLLKHIIINCFCTIYFPSELNVPVSRHCVTSLPLLYLVTKPGSFHSCLFTNIKTTCRLQTPYMVKMFFFLDST